MSYEDAERRLIELILSKPFPKENEVIFSRKEWLDTGFSKYYISKFIEKGLIKRKEPGIFSFKAREALLEKGSSLSDDNQEKCYQICIMMAWPKVDKLSVDSCYKAISILISHKKYDEIFKYIKIIKQTNSTKYVPDAVAIFVLLGYLTEIPENFKSWLDYIRGAKNGNIIKANEDKDSTFNKIRIMISEGLVKEAREALVNIPEEEKENTSKEIECLTYLISEAAQVKEERENMILNLIKQKKYQELVSELSNIRENCLLSQEEENLLKVAQSIVGVKEKITMPSTKTNKASNIQEALKVDNCLLAAIYANKEMLNQEENNENLLYLLLNDLYELKKENTTREDVMSIIRNSNNIEDVLLCVRNYLGTDNNQYLSYIQTLIDICQREQKGMGDVREALLQLKKGNFAPDVQEYFRKTAFYNNVSQIALSHQYYNLYTLAVLINPNLSITMTVVSPPIDDFDKSTGESANSYPTYRTRKPKYDIPESLEEYAKLLHMNLMIKKDIIILPHMTKDRMDELNEIIKEKYKDVVTYFIVEGEEKRLVLKYSPYIDDRDFNTAWFNFIPNIMQGNYETAIKQGLLVSHYNKNDKKNESIFAWLGGTYKELGECHLARQYYTLAKSLSKQERYKSEYEYMISRLIEMDSQAQVLETTDLILSKKDLNTEYCFGLEDAPTIIKMIIGKIDSGMSFDEACADLSDETKDIITLLIARREFIAGDEVFARYLLKTIENKKTTEKVLAIYYHILSEIPYYTSQKYNNDFQQIDNKSLYDLSLVLTREDFKKN